MIGIVILNYKTPSDVLTCVGSVREAVGEAYRIYVVDNDSPDGSYATLAAAFAGQDDVTVIESGRNGGFSFGNNVGFRRAVSDGCDLVLSTNADVLFRPGAPDRLAAALREEPDCVVAGPLVLFPDGEVQRYTRGILSARIYLARRKGLSFCAPESRASSLNPSSGSICAISDSSGSSAKHGTMRAGSSARRNSKQIHCRISSSHQLQHQL